MFKLFPSPNKEINWNILKVIGFAFLLPWQQHQGPWHVCFRSCKRNCSFYGVLCWQFSNLKSVSLENPNCLDCKRSIQHWSLTSHRYRQGLHYPSALAHHMTWWRCSVPHICLSIITNPIYCLWVWVSFYFLFFSSRLRSVCFVGKLNTVFCLLKS